MTIRPFIFSLIILTLLTSCQEQAETTELSETYLNEIETYRTDRDKARKSGYLKLTGLFKITDSIVSFGKSDDNTFQLDLDGIASMIGTIMTKPDSSLIFHANESIQITTENDSLITTMPLELDEYGSSIRLYHDRINWQVITRSKIHYLRVWDEKNPAIEAFRGFQYYDVNPNVIFEGDFTYYEQPKEEIVDAQLEGIRYTKFLGKISFEYNGEIHDLDVGNLGFTMVADETTDSETYGGGRYVYIELPETDGKTTLDLNKLYNPPCSFSEFTTCLYPPRQNYLPFKIEAGEKIAPNKE